MMSIKQRQRDKETKSYTYKEAQRERNKFAVQNANVKRPMDGPTDKMIYWNTWLKMLSYGVSVNFGMCETNKEGPALIPGLTLPQPQR